jgi:hypothetical protein
VRPSRNARDFRRESDDGRPRVPFAGDVGFGPLPGHISEGAKGAWASELGVPEAETRRISKASTFGAAWTAIEYESPLLVRELLTTAALPDQISGLRRALGRLRKNCLTALEHVQPAPEALAPREGCAKKPENSPMHWPMHLASRCQARSKRSGLRRR